MVDYSKWDKIDVSDDEEENPTPFKGTIASKTTASTMRHCFGCGKLNAKRKCGKCQTAHYCDVECQKQHWSDHKGECKKLADWRVNGREKEEIYLTEAEAENTVFTIRMGPFTASRLNRATFLSSPFNLDRTPEFQVKMLHEKFNNIVRESVSFAYSRGAIHLLMTKMDALDRSKLYFHFYSPKTIFSVMQHLLSGDIFDPLTGGFTSF